MTILIIDMSQIMYSNVLRLAKISPESIEEKFIRHALLTSVLLYKKKFQPTHVVLAFDSSNYWRKKYFPNYKAKRKTDRDDSKHDYEEIFRILNKIRDEFLEVLPFSTILVDTAEADDIIAVLTKHISATENVTIISSDHDYAQLQKYPGVVQFQPVQKKFVEKVNPHEFLIEHIIKGDSGDGIPNVMSGDDSFISSIRQTPITAKLYSSLRSELGDLENPNCSSSIRRNFDRNRTLIDFDCIPNDLQLNIIAEYEKQRLKQRKPLRDYFFKNQLKTLMDRINEFQN